MAKLTTQYPADALAEALEVSESGFAGHRAKPRRPRRRQDAELRPLVARSFAESRRTYGCLRVRLDLQELGHRCGKNRIARLMREERLRPRQKRRFRPRTTDSRHGHKVAPNWLAKVPAPDQPGQVWQSDITYLPTAEGWLYLLHARCLLAPLPRSPLPRRPARRLDDRDLPACSAILRWPSAPSQRSRQPVCRRRFPAMLERLGRHPEHEPQR